LLRSKDEEFIAAIMLDEEENDDLLVYCVNEGANEISVKITPVC
jgi:hypothetical protein